MRYEIGRFQCLLSHTNKDIRIEKDVKLYEKITESFKTEIIGLINFFRLKKTIAVSPSMVWGGGLLLTKGHSGPLFGI